MNATLNTAIVNKAGVFFRQTRKTSKRNSVDKFRKLYTQYARWDREVYVHQPWISNALLRLLNSALRLVDFEDFELLPTSWWSRCTILKDKCE